MVSGCTVRGVLSNQVDIESSVLGFTPSGFRNPTWGAVCDCCPELGIVGGYYYYFCRPPYSEFLSRNLERRTPYRNP